MKKIIVKKFDNKKNIFLKCKKILDIEVRKNNNIIISGGKTYYDFYKILSKDPISSDLNLFLSDERLVYKKKKLVNLFNIKNIFLKEGRKLPNFFFDIKNENLKNKNNLLNKVKLNFSKIPNNISLAFLGVGEDGHIASIFQDNIIYCKKEPFFISKNLSEEFYRLSFTFDYLKKIDQIIFVLFGKKKKILIKKINKNKYFKSNIFLNFLSKTKSKVKVFYA
jgi:6-phosphogluconolactonase/glucosamine-6-phosphate isomerase/deaminase